MRCCTRRVRGLQLVAAALLVCSGASDAIGPVHDYAPTGFAADTPMLLLYGGVGRHNFGDVLMGEMVHALALSHCSYQRRQIVFADVIGHDMRIHGGKNVFSLSTVAARVTSRRRTPATHRPATLQPKRPTRGHAQLAPAAPAPRLDVIAIGGEILGVSYPGARVMLQSYQWPPASIAAWQGEEHGPAERAMRRADSVYLPRRSWFRNPGAIVINAAGGRRVSSQDELALGEVNFTSFRNRLGARGVLTPDSVTLLPWLFGREVFERASLDGLLDKKYLAVQFNAMWLRLSLDELAEALCPRDTGDGEGATPP